MNESAAIDSQPRKAPRVLIVDDNPEIHRDFERALGAELEDASLASDEELIYGARRSGQTPKHFYEIEHAFSGLEALGKVRDSAQEDKPYQLAFVDIRMPGIDGIETIERIWKVDPRVQMVVCTAYSDYSWSDLARRLGSTDKLLVLKKPFDLIEVTQLASTLTEKWLLTKKAALKLEQMELLVARHVQRLLKLQRLETHQAGANSESPLASISADDILLDSESPQILLMVADATLREEIRQGLGAPFRMIDPEANGASLRQAEELVPDLIVISVAPGNPRGAEFCRRLKENEITSHIPLIALSASDSDEAHLAALEAGVDDFMVTPLRPALWRARVLNLLASHRQLHERPSQELRLEPRDIAGSQTDARFLRRMTDIVELHLSDFEFDVEELAQKMGVSRRQLFRKLRALSGSTPNGFIRVIRLKRAARLLEESQMTVTEITYAVGFSSLKHFRNLFREHFGALPMDYARKNSGN